MHRHNSYEAAFEAFLAARRIPYVAVDETRRAKFGDGSLKSLDFIVSPGGGETWLVDVKGRQFPSGRQKQYWKNWSTRDDLRSLALWQQLFGGPAVALFVFAYRVAGRRAPLAAEELFEHAGELYGFVAIRRDDYARGARPLSPRWDTVAMPTRDFRELAIPFADLLAPPPWPRPHWEAA